MPNLPATLQNHQAAGYLSPARALAALAPDFLDAHRCRAWLAAQLHPTGPACPHCRLPVPQAQRPRWLAWRRLQCTACGRSYRATTGTILAGCKLTPQQVVLLLLLLGLGQKPGAIARAVGCSAETVREWRARQSIITPTRRSSHA